MTDTTAHNPDSASDKAGTSPAVSLSDKAAARILAICSTQGAEKMLRITVEGGGCSGFQYKFDLVESSSEDDLVVENGGATLLIDELSLMYMNGSEVDYVDDLIGASFQVRNPNATSACGCGTSFTL